MPPKCSICKREDVEKINAALLASSQSFRVIASRHGLKTMDALWRHSKHLPAGLVEAHKAQQIAAADRLLERVDELRRQAEEILAAAMKEKDWRAATGAIREARGCIETMFKVAEIIQQQRYAPGDVEWWIRQLMRSFQALLADVAAGHRSPEQAMDAIVEDAERMMAAGPEGGP